MLGHEQQQTLHGKTDLQVQHLYTDEVDSEITLNITLCCYLFLTN